MAALDSVWTRPPGALRALGELVALTLDLPRWWASAALGLSARLGAALMGRRMLRRSYLGPLIERSRALSGATVTLHGVWQAPLVRGDPPRGDEGRHFHVLDVTVKPCLRGPGLHRWNPRDLALVAPGALAARPEEDLEVGRILRAQRWYRDRFVDADDSSLYGPQRHRLLVDLEQRARRFHFRYYLELLRRTPAF
jgi:hypothetical protein